jgi:hypothetical protein
LKKTFKKVDLLSHRDFPKQTVFKKIIINFNHIFKTMKKMISLKSILSDKEILTATEVTYIKGGLSGSGNSGSSVGSDDKRRPRPGGGASTQCIPG